MNIWGNATIHGTRIPLFRVVELYEAGHTIEEISTELYPNLKPEALMSALRSAGYSFLNTDSLDTYTFSSATLT